MNEITSLSYKLQAETGFHLSRTKFIAQFLLSVIERRTVNLSELSLSMSSGIKQASAYRKLQRFFQCFSMDYQLIARILINFLPSGALVLSIDRTNWKYGSVDINIFMLCANYKGIGIPILWKMLPKRGNSNTGERTELIQSFIELFGKGRIKHLLADREFIGKEWFSFLIKEQISFYIRIRNNTLIQTGNGKIVKAYRLFAYKQRFTFTGLKLGKDKLNLSGLYLGKGDYLIVASNVQGQKALTFYKDRWQIETFFSCLKTRGFRLEETHMNNPEKIKKLVALLALAFLWCHRMGEELDKTEPIKTKAHGRKASNFFRYGLDYLRKILSPLNSEFIWIRFYLKIFEQSISTITLKYP